MHTLYLIPALMDKTQNYIYYIKDEKTGVAAIVDPGESDPVVEFLKKNNLDFDYILITHHHWDHVNGIVKLKEYNSKANLVAAKMDLYRIPGNVDIALEYGEIFKLGSIDFEIVPIPCHTKHHIAYYSKDEKLLFCGDTMFSGGCGGLFEGTADEMFENFKKFSQISDDVEVCCAHEYTRSNLEFAEYLEPNNQDILQRMRDVESLMVQGKPTLPSTILIERKTNPFMKFNDEKMKVALGMSKDSSELDVFRRIMQEKSDFYQKKYQ